MMSLKVLDGVRLVVFVGDTMKSFAVGALLLVALSLPARGVAQTTSSKPAPKPAPKPVAAGITNADIIKMAKAGLSESLIITSIRQAEKRDFSRNADGLIELKMAGISENIMRVMLDPATISVGASVSRCRNAAARRSNGRCRSYQTKSARDG